MMCDCQSHDVGVANGLAQMVRDLGILNAPRCPIDGDFLEPIGEYQVLIHRNGVGGSLHSSTGGRGGRLRVVIQSYEGA
jgi:hypothetical protein